MRDATALSTWLLSCVFAAGFAGPAMVQAADNLITTASRYSVPETIDRIEKAVTAKGMTVFARIDHGLEATQVGLDMKPTVLLIFGNPKSGTALMVARPTAAIDLPMKALVWEDRNGKVWLTYNSPALLRERHGVAENLTSTLDPVGKLLEQSLE
ncbi:hypothetical protein W02_00710 [Nitrospira sp. KM1]|uniref:DUF302 domain-containing protein n=1 Tax=Nitrospira sp. KM1 TaxID=1936990 RepID=UPI0013A71AB4|nr:DUF302 domain-containing protein [Nitrospira sp. KM1]BCA52931.1 hypothetical protein W02_00710 [Nitrospira sp. KM1]